MSGAKPKTTPRALPADGAHALLWQNGQMIDLNGCIPAGSGWVLTGASDINNQGQICGTGKHNGQQAGFLLTPQ